MSHETKKGVETDDKTSEMIKRAKIEKIIAEWKKSKGDCVATAVVSPTEKKSITEWLQLFMSHYPKEELALVPATERQETIGSPWSELLFFGFVRPAQPLETLAQPEHEYDLPRHVPRTEFAIQLRHPSAKKFPGCWCCWPTNPQD